MRSAYDLSSPPSARLGYVVLATDHGSDRELAFLTPNSVQFNIIRVPSYITADPNEFAELLKTSTNLLPSPDSVGFACTSGSFGALGDHLNNLILPSATTPFITSKTAIIEALEALKLSRVALLTPYNPTQNETIGAELAANGCEVVTTVGLDIESDTDIARVSERTLKTVSLSLLDNDEVGGIVICCNALPVARCVEYIENHSGKPVITSNHALVWSMIRRSARHRSSQLAPVGNLGTLGSLLP